MLALATKRTVKNIFIIIAHNFFNESINAGLIGEKSIRLVFHKDILQNDIEEICDKIVHSSSKF